MEFHDLDCGLRTHFTTVTTVTICVGWKILVWILQCKGPAISSCP
uniref:Uncharacterized protein n=1 Tax=Rhizophora mucronata TaxID=61149 RepID=A0A2P2Q8Q4_RHIMU